MQGKNWLASRIQSFINCHKVMSAHILHATHDSLTMKENECRSTKRSFKNTSLRWLFSEQQDDDKWQSSWNHSCIIRSHWEVYFLNKVIKSSMKLLNSELLKSRDEITMIMNHMKNAEYSRNMKWLFEIQRSQKRDH